MRSGGAQQFGQRSQPAQSVFLLVTGLVGRSPKHSFAAGGAALFRLAAKPREIVSFVVCRAKDALDVGKLDRAPPGDDQQGGEQDHQGLVRRIVEHSRRTLHHLSGIDVQELRWAGIDIINNPWFATGASELRERF